MGWGRLKVRDGDRKKRRSTGEKVGSGDSVKGARSTSYFLILVKLKVMTVTGSPPEPLLRCTEGRSCILYQRKKTNKVDRGQEDTRSLPQHGGGEARKGRQEQSQSVAHLNTHMG